MLHICQMYTHTHVHLLVLRIQASEWVSGEGVHLVNEHEAAVGMQGSSSTSYTAPRLTYPQDPQEAPIGLHAEESESDILPFALDGDTGAFDATSPSADGKLGMGSLQPCFAPVVTSSTS